MAVQNDLLPTEELFHLEENERGLVALEKDYPIEKLLSSPVEEELAEDFLSEEVKKLSIAEQEKILFDVHGIAQADQDDPADVEVRLQETENEIQKIRRKSAYEQATYWNTAYVTDRSFRLRFLRSDRFDSQLAAQRIVRHFQIKRELFGDGAVLGRDVLLSDLSPLDTLALESGCFQVLPVRDGSGRSILSVAPMYRPDTCTNENCVRAMWYVFNAFMKDEENQRKGMVSIMSNFGERARRESFALVRLVQRVRSGIPKKLVGFHYCYDNPLLKPFVQGLRLVLAKDMRTRFRAHFGDRDSIFLGLQSYGIPTEHHPILPNGVLSLDRHKEWLEVRRTQEEIESSSDDMILPQRFDVLFGKDKYSRKHTGNLRALHLVEMHRAKYERAGKFEKTEIAERIVQIIYESHGRFLKWENKGWVEVDSSIARAKVSHFFRHLRSKETMKDEMSSQGLTNSASASA